jgi:hypothetical protein
MLGPAEGNPRRHVFHALSHNFGIVTHSFFAISNNFIHI